MINKVKLRYFNKEDKGLYATDNINLNETLLVIPFKLLLTFSAALDTPITRVIAKKNIDRKFAEGLKMGIYNSYQALRLLYENHRDDDEGHKFLTPYKTMLRVLPDDLDHNPLFFNEEELS